MGATQGPAAMLSRAAAFLQVLTNVADGDAVCHALAHGMLAGHHVGAVSLYAADDPAVRLQLVGQLGIAPDMQRDYTELEVRDALPHCEAFRAGQRLDLSGTDIMARFPLAGRAVESLVDLHFRLALWPLRIGGVPLGVLGLRRDPPTHEQPLPEEFIPLIVPALSMWVALHRPANDRLAGPVHGASLTERQRSVLLLADEGRSNSAIASQLGFSEGTIKADLTGLYRTLGASNRDDLLDRARKAGLLGDEPDLSR